MHLCFLFQALKAMVEEKFITAKEKAKEEVQNAAVVSLTADMWTIYS